jgi:hypothetical protein
VSPGQIRSRNVSVAREKLQFSVRADEALASSFSSSLLFSEATGHSGLGTAVQPSPTLVPTRQAMTAGNLVKDQSNMRTSRTARWFLGQLYGSNEIRNGTR